MQLEDIRAYQVASLQAAATLLAGLAETEPSTAASYTSVNAADKCLELAKDIFKKATGADWNI